jgi:hypothetical protein
VFPKSKHSPTLPPEHPIDCAIPRYVGFDFFDPKPLIVFYFRFLHLPLVAVPEMAVTKNDNLVFLERKIGMPEHLRLNCRAKFVFAQSFIKELLNQ